MVRLLIGYMYANKGRKLCETKDHGSTTSFGPNQVVAAGRFRNDSRAIY